MLTTSRLDCSPGCRVDLSRPGKASQFGCNFKVRIITDNDVVRPCGRISGNIVIETRFPISHLGLLVQFEALCTMRYSSKFQNQTQFHNGRENILEGARLVAYYGYFDSPIHSIISPIKYEAVSADAYIINPGSNSYPFSMTIPENLNLPAGFKNEYGSLVYRLAVYLKNAVQRKFIVEVGDKTMRFDGYCNLRNIELLPISVDCFYLKSMFSRKKVVEAHLLVQSSGFLRGESIPFRVEYKNSKCYPLHISVKLVQNLKYNATNKSAAVKLKSKVVKAVHNQIENDPIPEGVWMDFLCIPENQEPSYKVHFMYSVTYTLQFNVKIFLEIDQPVIIKGEAPIYIGTTRDDIETLRLTEGMSNLDILHVEAGRRGSEASLNTLTSGRTMKSLPPAYSQLSLRTPSWETLPPSYDELEPND